MVAVNAICGWQFPKDTIRRYVDSRSPKLLTMDFDFPSTKACNLRCKYCFIEEDKRQAIRPKEIFGDRLNVGELKRLFLQASELGCKSAKLVGDQEPFQEETFLAFVEYVTEELGIWLVIFTNGSILANDKLCKRIHGIDSQAVIEKLNGMRVSIMLKFHSFSNHIEDGLVRSKGYAERRNLVLERLIESGLNQPPEFSTSEEQLAMTGIKWGIAPESWTRLGLESVVMPQCLSDAGKIYRLKSEKRLFVDLDPPVPIGLTSSAEIRKKYNINVPQELMLELAQQIYAINEELGIPFEGASPYLGGLPCSQLPYSLYVNARGRIYPCCGCPEEENDGRSEYLGNVRDQGALHEAISNNPYRVHYQQHGFAYDTPPFNSPQYDGYGIYHGCPYRDRAGDILPSNWELVINEQFGDKLKSSVQQLH